MSDGVAMTVHGLGCGPKACFFVGPTIQCVHAITRVTRSGKLLQQCAIVRETFYKPHPGCFACGLIVPGAERFQAIDEMLCGESLAHR